MKMTTIQNVYWPMFSVTKEGSHISPRIFAGLNTNTAPELEMELQPMLTGAREFVLDLSELDYITSAGLRVLLKAAKIMEEQGEMIVLDPNDDAQEVFARTGFDGFLTIRHTQPEDACGDETAP